MPISWIDYGIINDIDSTKGDIILCFEAAAFGSARAAGYATAALGTATATFCLAGTAICLVGVACKAGAALQCHYTATAFGLAGIIYNARAATPWIGGVCNAGTAFTGSEQATIKKLAKKPNKYKYLINTPLVIKDYNR